MKCNGFYHEKKAYLCLVNTGEEAVERVIPQPFAVKSAEVVYPEKNEAVLSLKENQLTVKLGAKSAIAVALERE